MTNDRFDQTTSVLIRAFLRGHLVHGSQCACAVGNMIADAFDYEITDETEHTQHQWMKNGRIVYNIRWEDHDRALPYSRQDLISIEEAFERVVESGVMPYDLSLDPDGFRGLCAAIDTLMEIDEVETCCAEDVIALEGEYAEVAV